MPDDFYREPTPALSQGDLLVTPHLHISAVLEVTANGEVQTTSTGRTSLAIILNFDCEIAKPWSKRFVVCPVVPLSELEQSHRTSAKKNRIAHLFFLPRHRDLLTDSVAVLNQQTTINRDLIDPTKRIATLSTMGRLAMYTQFMRWLSRWELAELTCPHCGIQFDPAIGQPVRSPDDP